MDPLRSHSLSPASGVLCLSDIGVGRIRQPIDVLKVGGAPMSLDAVEAQPLCAAGRALLTGSNRRFVAVGAELGEALVVEQADSA